MKIRHYQEQSLTEIKKAFLDGHKRVLLWLATGAGKTFVFSLMIKEASKRGRKCLVIVRGRKLVDQASQRLTREGVEHGVLMANHWRYRPRENIQVCSIDTLISRNLTPEADLIIIDEAHMSTSEGYRVFLSRYDNAFIVAVTATPWTNNGLKHVADVVVHPITMQGLIDEGHLVPFRYFAPSNPDLSKVEVSNATKDYKNDQLADAMISGQLTGKIIDHWKKIVVDKPTLCFAVNVKHSKLIVENFLKAGISAEHCDADVPDEERNEIIKRLESGTTKIVSNVGIFCTGIDIPSLRAIIMARPTKSKNLFIQQAGRGTRTSEEKTDCILLDHAANISRHGFPTEESEVDLNGSTSKENSDRESKICKECFAVYRGPKCSECGSESEKKLVEIKESDEELKEITEVDPIKQLHKNLIKEAKKKNRKIAWAHYKLIDRVGFEAAQNYLPQWFVEKYKTGLSNIFASSPYRFKAE